MTLWSLLFGSHILHQKACVIHIFCLPLSRRPFTQSTEKFFNIWAWLGVLVRILADWAISSVDLRLLCWNIILVTSTVPTKLLTKGFSIQFCCCCWLLLSVGVNSSWIGLFYLWCCRITIRNIPWHLYFPGRNCIRHHNTIKMLLLADTVERSIQRSTLVILIAAALIKAISCIDAFICKACKVWTNTLTLAPLLINWLFRNALL